jgi:hypothetical protein
VGRKPERAAEGGEDSGAYSETPQARYKNQVEKERRNITNKIHVSVNNNIVCRLDEDDDDVRD